MSFKRLNYVFFALILGLFISCNDTQLLPSDKNITAFSFPQGTGVIVDTNSTTGTIAVTVPFGTPVTALIATFTTTGSSVAVGGTTQISGTTPNNFTGPVHYIVTAQDNSTKDYTVTVTVTAPIVGQVAPFTASGVTFDMVYVAVPSGGFTIQTRVDDDTSETISTSYWIGQTELTYQLWYTVKTWALAHGYSFYPGAWKEGSAGVVDAAPININQPVFGITWREAMVWTNALTEWYNSISGTNYTLSYFSDAAYTTPIKAAIHSGVNSNPGSQDNPYVKANSTGFRIPTIGEWELAARYIGTVAPTTQPLATAALTTNVGGVTYYWTPGAYASGATDNANNLVKTQLVDWCQQTATHDVKTKQANALGIYDMSGNMSEAVFSGTPDIRIICSTQWGNPCAGSYIGCELATSPNNPILGLRLVRTAP